MKRQIGMIRFCLASMATLVMVFVPGVYSPADGAGSKGIVETLDDIGILGTFARAVHRGQIEEVLREGGTFTVFAPNEEAFVRLPAETIEMLFALDNRDELDALLAYHVVPEELASSRMKAGCSATALNEEILHITARSGAFFVQDARIIKADIMCTNGVIHIIDRVILNSD